METLVIILVVLGACAFLARGVYRTVTGKASTCGCGVKTCPMQKDCGQQAGSCSEAPVAPVSRKAKQ